MESAVNVKQIASKLNDFVHSEQFNNDPELESLLDKMSALNTMFKKEELSLSSQGIEHLNSISKMPSPISWSWTKYIDW